jgi:hypothetical protein
VCIEEKIESYTTRNTTAYTFAQDNQKPTNEKSTTPNAILPTRTLTHLEFGLRKFDVWHDKRAGEYKIKVVINRMNCLL